MKCAVADASVWLDELAVRLRHVATHLAEWALEAGVDKDEAVLRFRAALTREPDPPLIVQEGKKRGGNARTRCIIARCSHSHYDRSPTWLAMVASFVRNYNSFGTTHSARGKRKGGGGDGSVWER